jgi:hypothetical protein
MDEISLLVICQPVIFNPSTFISNQTDIKIVKPPIMVPSMFAILVNTPTAKNYDISSVNAFMYGASPMPESLLLRTMRTSSKLCVIAVVSDTPEGKAITPKSVEEQYRGLIGGFKVPRTVQIRSPSEPLPKSGAGRILKTVLREKYWKDAARDDIYAKKETDFLRLIIQNEFSSSTLFLE